MRKEQFMYEDKNSSDRKPEWSSIDAPRRVTKPPLFLLSRRNRVIGGVFGGIANKLCSQRHLSPRLVAWLLRLGWITVLILLLKYVAWSIISYALCFCVIISPYLVAMLLLHEDSNEELMPDPNMKNKK